MEDADFSDDFCRFVQGAIPAVDAAELLLLLADRPDAWWYPAEALAKLRPAGVTMSEAEAERYADTFVAQGLVESGPERKLRYRPASEALARHVLTLAQAYEERPVTLIRMIYALRDTKIQTFADAFKLRKK
jgi:hypothetical protein